MKKDCLIVTMFSKTETSYRWHYIRALEEKNKLYDIVFFDRYLTDQSDSDNEFVFKKYCPTGGSKIKKIGTMLEYAAYVRRLLKTNQYRSVIVLTTVPAVFLYDVLIRRFKEKYILDIRDYTYEHVALYRKMVGKLIEHSFMTVISSKGFKRFLPDRYSYVVTHNIPDLTRVKSTSGKTGHKPIQIGFVGSIRYFEENKKIIRDFMDDPQFSLHYYGTMTNDCDLQEYCKTLGCRTVFFHGRFDNSEKEKIYSQIDIINSIYGDFGLETSTAVPNRFYDAALYHCPIIVSKGTYLAELVEEYKLGFAVDVFHEDIHKKLTEYLSSFDKEVFDYGCSRLLADVKEDMNTFNHRIFEFIEATEK